MQHGLDFFHHPGNAAGIIEILGGPVAGRTDIQQIMGAPVHSVKGIRIDLDAKLMGNGRNVHGGIGGAGNGRVDHDGIFKALLRHNILGPDAGFHQFHQLHTGIIGRLLQFRSRGRHQRCAGKHQTQRLCHDLHSGSRSHKGAGTAAGAGMLFIVVQLLLGDHTGLLPGIEFTDLLQGQQFIDGAGRIIGNQVPGQHMGFHNTAGHHNGTHILQSANAHQHGRHGFITTGHKHTAIVDAGIGLCLHQIHHGIPMGQGIIDTVMPLGNTVTHIRGIVSGCLAAIGIHRFHCLLNELVQMGAAGMAVAKSAFHQNLRFSQIRYGPAHTDFQRIVFRSQNTNLLRT